VVPAHRSAGLRPLVEFLVILAVGILFFRVFAAEAYIVPTGSMAPTLLGSHRDLICPNCGIRFAIGLDEEGRSGLPACPNCGHDELEQAASADGAGDRLLVQKLLYDLRPPRRWEVAVFQNPEDPKQAFVKRVVGRPGESVEIRRGDIYINGRVARKNLEEQRATRILVYNNDFLPADADRFPRWIARKEGGSRAQSAWRAVGSGFVREDPADDRGRTDWLEYRHWQPDRKSPGPVRDFIAYNGAETGSENRVDDLILDALVSVRPDCRALRVRLSHGADRFESAIPVDDRAPLRIVWNRQKLRPGSIRGRLASSSAEAPRFHRVEASVVDQQFLVAIDGRPAFEPVKVDDPSTGPVPPTSELAIGLDGGSGEVRGLQVFRDVYYTSVLSTGLRRPFAVGEPYQLGPGEYFVLGDNSPVSNDSRFWPVSPVVREETFLGKPFLVHLPSQAVPLKVFGQAVYWVPDPRQIRYIR
jgi:signal peptidase I